MLKRKEIKSNMATKNVKEEQNGMSEERVDMETNYGNLKDIDERLWFSRHIVSGSQDSL